MLSRLENDVLGNAMGLEALDGALTRATDALLKRKNKRRLIIDLDSTEDPAHGKQKGVAYNGHFAKPCFHPLFFFTSEGDCLRAKLRQGNVHSADDWLKEADRLGVFTRSKRLKKDFGTAQPRLLHNLRYCLLFPGHHSVP
jgi:hypothetical protein